MHKNLLNNFFIIFVIQAVCLIISLHLMAKLTHCVLTFWVIKSMYVAIGSQMLYCIKIEVYILAIRLFLSYIAIIIQLDFIKDFGNTYFLKQYKNNQPDVH